LTDRPDQARWLTADERNWISREFENETRARKAARTYTIWQAVRDQRVLMLIVPYFLAHIGAQASVF
jgi:ACS family tartrate transporter-like MFS transporter